MYAAKRFSCGPGVERRDPTKQFYTRLFLFNTVVLVGRECSRPLRPARFGHVSAEAVLIRAGSPLTPILPLRRVTPRLGAKPAPHLDLFERLRSSGQFVQAQAGGFRTLAPNHRQSERCEARLRRNSPVDPRVGGTPSGLRCMGAPGPAGCSQFILPRGIKRSAAAGWLRAPRQKCLGSGTAPE